MQLTDQETVQKIVNPELARGPMRGDKPHGEFKAIVHLASPDKHPPYMKILGLYSPGFLKARIPCSQINRISADANVLSVELREHVSDMPHC